MGPSCKRKTRKSRKGSCKKHKSDETATVAVAVPAAAQCSSPVSPLKNIDGIVDSACTTPKAEKFRIPEIKTCPPAPKKKRRILSNNCSLRRRSPIAFFSPPDLELFFFVALRDHVSA